MKRAVPGYLGSHALAVLTCRPLYAARATQHRPLDPLALAAEIRRQASIGQKPLDISEALDIGLDHVINVLAEDPQP